MKQNDHRANNTLVSNVYWKCQTPNSAQCSVVAPCVSSVSGQVIETNIGRKYLHALLAVKQYFAFS